MELKPCPFCQGTLLHTPTHDVQPDGLWSGQVECGNCEARGPNAFWYDNDEDAENAAGEAWNAIAAQLAAPVAAGSLIAELREHDDPRLYHEADVLMSRAAARIAELEAAAPVAAQETNWQQDALRKALEFMLDRFEGREGNIFSQRLACAKARDAIAAVDAAPGARQPDAIRQHIEQRLAELPDSWLTAREELKTVLRLLYRA